jgi:hypothetical protein
LVHNDYSAKSGPRRVWDHLPAEEAEQRLRSRFAEINVWRPIRGPVESTPLALCDARSIDAQDFVPVHLVYPDKVGESYYFTHNPNHRWFYFPRLEKNEVILLKCYDSKEDVRARFTAHTAFDDRTRPPDAPPRESIEVARWFSGLIRIVSDPLLSKGDRPFRIATPFGFQRELTGKADRAFTNQVA